MKRLFEIPTGIVAALAVCLAFVLGGGILAPTVARADDPININTMNIELYSGDWSELITSYYGTSQTTTRHKEYTYDGNTKNVTVRSVYPPSGGLSLSQGTDYTVSGILSAMNRGTYTVTVTGTGNYTGSVDLTWTINPSVVTGSTGVWYQLDENPTYDGKEHTVPILTLRVNQLTAQPSDYNVGTVLVGQGTVTPIDAGDYTSYLSWTGTGNFSGYQPNIPWKILPATLSNVSVTQNGTLTYDGNAHSVKDIVTANATSVNNQQVTFTYSTSEDGTYTETGPSFTNAGTYTVYYKATAPNHNDASGSFTVTIGKAYASAVVTARTGLVYTGQAQDLVTVGATTGGTISGWSQYTDIESGAYDRSLSAPPTRTNAGTYRLRYTVTATDTTNYMDRAYQVDVTIANATLTGVSAAQDGTLTYNGTAQTANVTTTATSVNNQKVTFSYKTSEDGEYATTVPPFTEAGEHTVYYKASAPNHNDATGSFKVTIGRKDITNAVFSMGDSPTYTGGVLDAPVNSVTIAGVTGNVTYTVTSGGSGTNADSYTLAIEGTGNFTGSASTVWSISKASQTVSAENLTLTYGDTASIEATGIGTLTYEVTDGADVVSVDGTGAITTSRAGTAQVTVMAAGDSNHLEGSGTVEVAVTNATLTNVTVTQDGALTYNGRPQSASVATTATSVNDQPVTFTYGTSEDGEYAATVPSFTNAGTYTVWYKASAPNHETTTGSFEVTIAKIESWASVTVKTPIAYDGSPHELVTSAEVMGGTLVYSIDGGKTWSEDLPTATDPGTYTVLFRVVGDLNHEDSETGSLEVEIVKPAADGGSTSHTSHAASASVGVPPTGDGTSASILVLLDALGIAVLAVGSHLRRHAA